MPPLAGIIWKNIQSMRCYIFKRGPCHEGKSRQTFKFYLQSVCVSGILSLALSMWIALGGLFNPPPPFPGVYLPVSAAGCVKLNNTMHSTFPGVMSTAAMTNMYSANFSAVTDSAQLSDSRWAIILLATYPHELFSP